MLTLKEYQQRTIDTLRDYFRKCLELNNAETAFYEITRQTYGMGIPYRQVKELPGLPYVCLRIPTGGGKTFVACHSIGITANELLHTENPVVLWLVPSNAIREQTINALKNQEHPYRQALETDFPLVTVLSLRDALYINRSTLATSTTIIVSTMQAFRVDDTEGRKVYEQSGALMEHFSGIDLGIFKDFDRYEDGKPIPSLSNLLRLHRPIIIVDEAHNARTRLSFETLARFNPSCIIEFTATPDTDSSPSNVLHTVSAAELKADQMIKMPIILENQPEWKELLGRAIAMRRHLEELALQERYQTNEYIRPIMLIQAQPKRQEQETLTVEVVEECLLQDYSIPAVQICRATGNDKGLEGIDLAESACEIRYIITIQALKEGWDCPFAYVLCSVAELRSSTAVEQILGRIMRLPKAKNKNIAELNSAYAFAASRSFYDTAQALRDALIQNGFDRQEAKDFITQMSMHQVTVSELERLSMVVTEEIPEAPKLNKLPSIVAERVHYDVKSSTLSFTGIMEEEVKYQIEQCFTTPEAKKVVERVYRRSRGLSPEPPKTPSERGEVFTVPVLAVKQRDLFEVFEETHFLDHPWHLSKCDFRLTEAEYLPRQAISEKARIDIDKKGHIATEFLGRLQDQVALLFEVATWTPGQFVTWFDRKIPHPDITQQEATPFLVNLMRYLVEDRRISIEKLFHDKYNLRKTVEAKIAELRKAASLHAYQRMLLPDCDTPLVVAPDFCFKFSPHEYPYQRPYRGNYKFQKHYYKEVGDLKSEGEELECAVFLDSMEELKFWVRNLERRRNHSFWLQTSTDKFYPDFVCLLHDGRYLVVEYKGADRWSDDDSKEKRIIGEIWELRSNGKCLFVMPKGKDFNAIRGKIG